MVTNNGVATVADWSNPGAGDWSTTLVDLVSCAQIAITDSYLRTTAGHKYKGGGSFRALQFRARRDIDGCDLPAYNSTEFNNSDFWAKVNALPIDAPGNGFAFQKYVSDVSFEFIPFDFKRPKSGIRDDGTYPLNAVAQFSGLSVYLGVPSFWVERATVFTANIEWINYASDERYSFDAYAPADLEASDPSAIYPPPSRYHVSLGGEDGVPVALPDWFKTDATVGGCSSTTARVGSDCATNNSDKTPVAHAGGPYKAISGETLTLDASNSEHPTGDSLRYLWDTNGDGITDVEGVAPSIVVPRVVTTRIVTIALSVKTGASTGAKTRSAGRVVSAMVFHLG